MKHRSIHSLILPGLLLLAVPLRADVKPDLSFTAFANTDINTLAGGNVLQARGGLINFQRGITSQALFIINAAPTDVQQKLLTWDPASHPELKVWLHKDLPAKPMPSDFSALRSLPDNSSADYLVDTTAKLDPSNPVLQFDKSEMQLISPALAQYKDKKDLFVNFWGQILAGRAANFLSGKFASANYDISGGNIVVLDEIKSLLRSDALIYKDFHPLFADTAIYSSTKIAPTTLYYDCFDVQGYGVLGTGAIFQRSDANSIQSADIEYYCNSTIYTTIELEKLWPVTVNGKNVTLVWRADLVSTSNVAYLHGVERMASGMIMLQEVKQGIDAFRAEFK